MRFSILLPVLLVLPLVAHPAAAAPRGGAEAPPVPRVVELAICLDTSGSMRGLIDATRAKLWDIVGEISRLKPMPELRVALITYGSPGSEETGFVVRATDFTTNHDLIYERLFEIRTSGGTENVGRVLDVALKDLAWTSRAGLQLVFVAGNESADQDRTFSFRDGARAAAAAGIHVNAVYCGGPDDLDAATWRELATLAKGRFSNIDHNHGTVSIPTPFDTRLGALSGALNETYVFYGAARREAADRQRAQDANAEQAGAPAAAGRAEAKAGGLYGLENDLVGRLLDPGFDLTKVAEKDLPEALRAMSAAERKAHLTELAAKRKALQAEIKKLGDQRRAWLQAEMAKRRLDDSQAFDRALRDAIREQAAAHGFVTGE